jgi:hypothetical protein
MSFLMKWRISVSESSAQSSIAERARPESLAHFSVAAM